MNVAPNAAASQVAKQRQGEGVTHGVDVKVRDQFGQGLPSQKDGPHALSQQGELWKQTGLHQDPVLQEDEPDRPRQHDVEALTGSLQDLLAGHAQVPSVHHKVDVHVPANGLVALNAKGNFHEIKIQNSALFSLHFIPLNNYFFKVLMLPVL